MSNGVWGKFGFGEILGRQEVLGLRDFGREIPRHLKLSRSEVWLGNSCRRDGCVLNIFKLNYRKFNS